jgi:hypothetical protein
MSASDILPWMQIIQSCVTTVSIIAGGAWVIYTFILGRSFAGNVCLACEVEKIISTSSHQKVILQVRAKNIGRTRLKQDHCKVILFPLNDISTRKVGGFAKQIDQSIEEISRQENGQLFVFSGQRYLEPDEEMTEHVLLQLDHVSTIQVIMKYYGKVRHFTLLPPLYKEETLWTYSTIIYVNSTDDN